MALRNYAEVKQVMDDLISFNPEFKNPDAHLLYARNLEHLGDVPAALHEYATLNDYFLALRLAIITPSCFKLRGIGIRLAVSMKTSCIRPKYLVLTTTIFTENGLNWLKKSLKFLEATVRRTNSHSLQLNLYLGMQGEYSSSAGHIAA